MTSTNNGNTNNNTRSRRLEGKITDKIPTCFSGSLVQGFNEYSGYSGQPVPNFGSLTKQFCLPFFLSLPVKLYYHIESCRALRLARGHTRIASDAYFKIMAFKMYSGTELS
jgi:hypothetical protein